MPEDHGACRALAQMNDTIYIGSTANSVLISSLNRTESPSLHQPEGGASTNQITATISDNWSIATQVGKCIFNVFIFNVFIKRHQRQLNFA